MVRETDLQAPAGFEQYFAGLVALGGSTQVDPDVRAELSARYGLEVAPESVPDLLRRFQLVLGEPLLP